MASPRFITAGEVAQDETKDVKYLSKILTNDQILASPSAITELVPPTSVIDYDGWPDKLFVPVLVVAVLDSRGGEYTNLTNPINLSIVLGDQDTSLAKYDGAGPYFGAASKTFFRFEILPSNGAQIQFGNGDMRDNGLSLAVDNADGPLTGGHADNTLTFRIYQATVPFA